MLQLVGNLLVKKIDSDETKYSRNLTLTQIFCGVGGLGGGFLISYLIKNLGFQWQSIYFIFTALSALVAGMLFLTKIPENSEKTAIKKPTVKEYLDLAKNPLMILFAAGIFIYVGIEVGISTWISTYLIDNHGFTKTTAAQIVGLYWGFQALGRFGGGIVLNYINTSKAIILYSFACLCSLMLAVLTPVGAYSAIGFIAVGFFTSIMFPSIFSLAVNSFDQRQEGTVGGIICTTIVGGAIIPPFIGYLNHYTNSLGYSLIITSSIAFLYIAFIGLITIPRGQKSQMKAKNITLISKKRSRDSGQKDEEFVAR